MIASLEAMVLGFLDRCDRGLTLFERYIESHELLSSTSAGLAAQNARALELAEDANRAQEGGMFGMLNQMARMVNAVDGRDEEPPE